MHDFGVRQEIGRYIRNLVFEIDRMQTPHTFVLFVRQEQVNEIRKLVSSEKFEIVGTTIHWHSIKEQIMFSRVIAKEQVDLMHFPYSPFLFLILDRLSSLFMILSIIILPQELLRPCPRLFIASKLRI